MTDIFLVLFIGSTLLTLGAAVHATIRGRLMWFFVVILIPLAWAPYVTLGHRSRTAAQESEPRSHKLARALLILIIVGYLALAAWTAHEGGESLRLRHFQDMKRGAEEQEGWFELSPWMLIGTRIADDDCSVRSLAPCPFVIILDTEFTAGPQGGDGSHHLYLWLAGIYTIEVAGWSRGE